MARPTLKDDQRRTVRKQFRFTPMEWRALAGKALKNRIYVAEQIRWECCGVEPPRRQASPFRKGLIRTQGSIGKMRSNVQQIHRAIQSLPAGDALHTVDPDLYSQAEGWLEQFSDHLLDVLTAGPLPQAAGAMLTGQLVDLDLMGKNLNDLARTLNRQLAAKAGTPVLRVAPDYVTVTLTALRALTLHIVQFLAKEMTHDGNSR